MIRGKTPRPTPAKIGVGPEVKKTAGNYLPLKLCETQLLQTLFVTIAKKTSHSTFLQGNVSTIFFGGTR